MYIRIYRRAENHTSPQIQTLEVNIDMNDKVSYVKSENLSKIVLFKLFAAVQVAVLDGFGDVRDADIGRFLQIGNRAGNL